MAQIDPKQIKQDGAALGQALIWDGSAWVPGDAGGGVVDPSVIPSNQESPFASGLVSSTIDANTAIFMPFHVHTNVTVKRISVFNPGNTFDVGIYELDGTKLVSSGSTAAGVDGQIVDITDTALSAGRYYMAYVQNASTAMYHWTDPLASALNIPEGSAGIKRQNSAFPLPSSATLADGTSNAHFPAMALLLEA